MILRSENFNGRFQFIYCLLTWGAKSSTYRKYAANFSTDVVEGNARPHPFAGKETSHIWGVR